MKSPLFYARNLARYQARQWLRYAFLLGTFRNGITLLWRYCQCRPCGQAILWSGTVVRHNPERLGLVETILEIWLEQSYTQYLPPPMPGAVILDVGANVGLFTIWMARRFPNCRVVALEPFPDNYQLLLQNVASARVNNVECHQLALGSTTGRGTMVDGGTRSLDHQLIPAATLNGPDMTSIVTLADLLDLVKAPGKIFCKMDIEGSEYDVFAHADQAITARIEQYAIEYHDNLRPGALALLRQRLEPTHQLSVRNEPPDLYGFVYATRRNV